MKVLVVADSHIYKSSDNKYWCKTIYGYEFWERYLDVFDSVKVLSRVGEVLEDDVKDMIRVDGPMVEVSELPFLRGMNEYILGYTSLIKDVKRSVAGTDCAIFRLPSVVAFLALKFYKKTNNPFSVEVVVDPETAYSENWFAKKIYTRKLKKAVISANGVTYVTEKFLQKKYPSYKSIHGEDDKHFESYFSTIDLEDWFFGEARKYKNKKKFTLVHTANSINSDVKGHSIVLKVVKLLREKSYLVDVIFIGDGDKRQEFENMAKDMNIYDYVEFTGLLSSKMDIKNILMKGDIFIFPSKAEGLPRAIIEAMATGLPCLSTPVSGIPELIDIKYLFEPTDSHSFANKIINLIENPKELEKMSIENIEKAKKYKKKKIQSRRIEFYKKLYSLANDNKTTIKDI